MPIATLAPLFELAGVTFVSLQVGDRAAEALEYGLHIPPTYDYLDTARVISALDCVIGVDTSVVHLAGALGVPTLVMLPTNPDWRWGLGGESNPWYRSVRCIRQRHANDWGPVVASVRERLTAYQQIRGEHVA